MINEIYLVIIIVKEVIRMKDFEDWILYMHSFLMQSNLTTRSQAYLPQVKDYFEVCALFTSNSNKISTNRL